jgi:uncharacterized protein YjbI with pentapeptide repeats
MKEVALGPLSIGTIEWRGPSGAQRVTIIVKATMTLRHDQDAELAAPVPLAHDEHYEGNVDRSLRVPSDFALRKPRTDVVFVGGVYAPPGTRVTQRRARLAVEGVVDKTIVAMGPRTKSAPNPAAFAYLPMRYELAYGGPTSKINPVGVGADPRDDRLPSIVDPQHEARVAGFGPVPATWFWRKRAGGKHDLLTWMTESPQVPAGVDWAVFNAAPPDQQVPHMKGDEWIVLEGLHPSMERVRSRLPGQRVRVRIEGQNLTGEPIEPKMVLDTLVIDGDTLTATLTFRADIPAFETGAATLYAALAREGETPTWKTEEPVLDKEVPEEPPLWGYKEPARTSAIDLERTSPRLQVKAEADKPGAPQPKPPPRTADAVPIVNTTKLVAFTTPWQMPPSGDVPEGDETSLRYASDFAIFKPSADVMLVGHAYPGNRKDIATVQMRVGQVKQQVAVFGDRTWDASGQQSAPAEFKSMPLRYERAMGGALSQDNPVGRGFKSGVLLPNLERPDALVRTKADQPPPACFAPISTEWRLRRSKLGTYDSSWLKTRWPYFPADFDWSYFNAAAPDWQIPYLTGDEEFVLAGVNKDHPVIQGPKLTTVRPRVFAQCTTEAGEDFFEVLLRLDTVWFDPDAMKLVLVWRGLFDVKDEDAPEISCLFVTDKPGSLREAKSRLFTELAILGFAPTDVPSLDDVPSGPKTPDAPVVDRAAIEAWLANGELAGKDLSRADLTGLALGKADLAGCILAGAMLKDAVLDGANLAGATLAGADARGVSFAGADLKGCDLAGANLQGAKLAGANLEGASLEGARCAGADFTGIKGKEASFAGASLEKARFDRASLTAADFSKTTLDGVRFNEAALEAARFYDARGEKVVFEKATMAGVRATNAKLPRCVLTGVKGPEASFDRADLEGAVGHDVALPGGLFLRANLARASFGAADLSGAVLRRAVLKGASLLKANLMGASLERADLEGADLRGANLFRAETWRAKTRGTKLELANVTGTKLQ